MNTRTFLLLALACTLPLGAKEPRPLMKDFIGINGHTVQFKPGLYAPVCRFVRDYHPVEWDLAKDTVALPEFPFAKNRVDWNKVYGSWVANGFTVDACLMFETLKQPRWTDVEKDARGYGRTFAAEFGPSGARKLVESVEIGNEPGDWSDEEYTRIFRAMAEGVREGDAKMKIATCNLTTGKSGKYEKSVDCVAKDTRLFDVLNIHTYAQLENWPTWRRSYPEDPRLKKYTQDVDDLCRWRDANAPGKPVWVTEFGYDSSTKPAEKTGDFAKWVGVTDEQQAQWLVRSLLQFSTMTIERAYIYFFNDDDKPALHASAGITRNFQPKPSFHALAHMQRTLGDFRFERIVRDEPGKVRAQEFRNGAGEIVWVVWSPTGTGASTPLKLAVKDLPGKLTALSRMPLNTDAYVLALPDTSGGELSFEVNESPFYLTFEKQ